MLKSSSPVEGNRWWDLFSVSLILLLLQILTLRLSATHWIDNLDVLPGLTIPAIILGLLLGYSRFPAWVSGGMALFHGSVAVAGLAGMAYAKGLPWLERLGLVLERLRYSISMIRDSAQLDDPLLFFVAICIVIWIIAISAAYFHTRRGSIWVVVIPSAIIFLLIDRYDLSGKLRSLYFFFFILSVILLLMRTALVQKRRQWIDSGILVPPGVTFELTRAAAAVALLILSVIWLLPAFSKLSDPASRFWREITRPLDGTREKLANALAPLKSSNVSGNIQFYDSMSIGNTARQESTVVFTARAFARDPLLYRYYWRTRSYDHYENGNWMTTSDVELKEPAGFTQPAMEDWEARLPMTFQFTTQTKTMNMFVTEQSPFQISLDSRIFGVEISPSLADVDYLKPVDPLERGVSYRVSSLKSIPTISQLQASGSTYPEWVTSHYLEIPANVELLASQLAQNIIKGKNDPYARVDAITRYLRDNFKYMTNIPPTPQGEDPIDVFLFSDRQGFCNHFATAEVLLLRSIGIPARMAIGFAEGEYDEISDLYVVRIKDTHAWPEVYFADYGWVIFEPTTNQVPLVYEPSPAENDRRSGNGSSDVPGSFSATPEPVRNTTLPADDLPLKRMPFSSTERILPLIVLILVEASVFVILFMLIQRLPDKPGSMVMMMESSFRWTGGKPPRWLTRWSAYLKRLPLEQAFIFPDMLFGLLRLPLNPSQTVRERVELWEGLLPEIKPFSSVLLREYEKELYAGGRGNYALAFHASRMIDRKIIRAVFLRLLHVKGKKKIDG